LDRPTHQKPELIRAGHGLERRLAGGELPEDLCQAGDEAASVQLRDPAAAAVEVHQGADQVGLLSEGGGRRPVEVRHDPSQRISGAAVEAGDRQLHHFVHLGVVEVALEPISLINLGRN
jgi:hypothetical protein